jgi:putative restriction endonuclease
VNLQEFLDEVEVQRAWRAHGVRAPHKPLTILYGIKLALTGQRLIPYREAAPELSRLLIRYGPPRDPNPQDPAWRLAHRNGARTRIWEVRSEQRIRTGPSNNPSIQDLKAFAEVGLSAAAYSLFHNNPAAAHAAATRIASLILPESLQDELVEDVLGGRVPEPTTATSKHEPPCLEPIVREFEATSRIRRDPSFAPRIRAAYGDTCAVCTISPRLGNATFGLEAAHIWWARGGGPDAIPNGIYLCRMHHVALDRGAITVDQQMRLRVNPALNNAPASARMFHEFDKRPIRLPANDRDAPSLEMLRWHWKQVFGLANLNHDHATDSRR